MYGKTILRKYVCNAVAHGACADDCDFLNCLNHN
jgi:hypothetical protein